ncbi:MAG: hypothetical protein GY819_05455 [Planctomycetaceae bacterium]|nr:hypothetical protein [Planctomycetaceae bacterium]
MEVVISDNARRHLCRFGFVVLCALPTLLCLNSVLFPPSRADWSTQIQQSFGVINQLESVQTLSPRRTDFQGLILGGDRFESRLELGDASLRSLNEGRVLYVENARGSVTALWAVIDRLIETVTWNGKSDRPVQLQFATLTFLEGEHEEARTCLWRDVRVVVDQQGRFFSVAFQAEDKTSRWESGRQFAVIERTTKAEQEDWYFDAVGFSIPAWVLQQMIPMTQTLNPNVNFVDAKATLVRSQMEWSGELSGQLRDADLQYIVGERFDRMLDGQAMINLKNVRLKNSRIEFLEGDLHSPVGTISSTLLHASHHAMGMQLVEPYGQQAFESYADLRLGFQLKADQLSIYGMESGAVLNDARGNQMLVAQHGATWPSSAIVDLVAWPWQQVNANTSAVARYLIMPPVQEDHNSEMRRTGRTGAVGNGNFFNR